MKAFTFLGRGQLHESTYVYQNQECRTRFFAEAVVNFFAPEQLMIVSTERASKEPVSNEDATERLSYLQRLLGERTAVIPVNIPEGESEDQLWGIFNTVVAHIHEGDRILFDITHGFRSLPFLTFLALAYVRNVRKDVVIERVVYGAFDAVERDNPRKPVFDLTPFIGLLDWMGAVSIFQRTGNARSIASLLKEAQNRPYKQGLSGDLPRRLISAAGVLGNLSDALLTNRTLEVQMAAAELTNRLVEAEPDVAKWAQPFQALIEQVQETYAPQALKNPEEQENDRESLIRQHRQIQWYVENQQYLQAAMLTREWLVSWACFQLELDWLNGDDRERAEKMLNDWNYAKRQGLSLADLSTVGMEHGVACLKVWDIAIQLRNDLAHCGMPSPGQDLRHAQRRKLGKNSASTAIHGVQRLMSELNTFVEVALPYQATQP